MPAAGVRNYPDGSLLSRGLHGFYWSSSENGAHGYYLYILSGDVRAGYPADRANGFSVRCVAELKLESVNSAHILDYVAGASSEVS